MERAQARKDDRSPAHRDGGRDRGPLEPQPIEADLAGLVAPERRDGPIIVDDALEGGPIDRAEFLARLRATAKRTTAGVIGPRWNVDDCPYIDAWFERHAGIDAAQLEHLARRYGGITGPTSPDELLDAVRLRIKLGVAYWHSGEDIAGELALSGLSETAQAVGDAGGDAASAQRVIAELGDGAPLPAAAGRATSAIGGATSDVRVHTDAGAARLAEAVDATAFTVGRHVVYGGDAPRPGTLAGDVLLAHELAHVEQQRGGDRGGPTPGPAHERAADHAAVGAAVPGLAGRAKTAMHSGLALQRCKGKKKGGGSKDAGAAGPAVEDAAAAPALDAGAIQDAAAAAPAAAFHLSTELIDPAVDAVKLARGDHLNKLAKQFYGQGKYDTVIGLANPDLPEKLQIGTEIALPTIEVAGPAPSIEVDRSRQDWIGYRTWHVERDPRESRKFGRKPSHPSKDSGVTLGHGYDMARRSEDQIERELRAAGVSVALAQTYRSASDKTGDDAKDWIDDHRDIDAITEEQDDTLFEQEYQRHAAGLTENILDRRPKALEGAGAAATFKLGFDLAGLDPKIVEVLIDIRYKGNLNETSWAYLEEAIRKNDVEAFSNRIHDPEKYRDNSLGQVYERYSVRCGILGIAPEPKDASWPK